LNWAQLEVNSAQISFISAQESFISAQESFISAQESFYSGLSPKSRGGLSSAKADDVKMAQRFSPGIGM
jgi:hypothetical protein